MLDVIYLGYVIRPEEVHTASGASVAGNKMQWNVVKCLGENDDIRIHCVTVMPLAAFPRDRKIWQKKQRGQLTQQVAATRISYMNLPGVKQLWQTINVYIEARKLLKKYPNAVVFAFNLFPQVGIPIRWLSKKAATVCLLADLPIDDNTNRRGVSLWLRRLFEKSTWKNMVSCERYIVLNPHVAELYLPGKQYIVVDGGVDEGEIKPLVDNTFERKERNIMFCGALTEYNGIKNLILAMGLVDDNRIVLDIYGDGYLRDVVEEAAKVNTRIRYHGRVSNEIVMQKQQEAWGLINPRITEDPIAKVTFPSKTFEYLLSGTPVITTRLNGYGPEYENCMIFAEQDTPEGIAAAINRMLEMPASELEDMASRARNMVCTQKTWGKQAQRIAEFLVLSSKSMQKAGD